MHKGCMQVPDVMHVPWRTKYGHKDSCHHNKFYKTWIISGSVIWHTHNNYEYDHVPTMFLLHAKQMASMSPTAVGGASNKIND